MDTKEEILIAMEESLDGNSSFERVSTAIMLANLHALLDIRDILKAGLEVQVDRGDTGPTAQVH